MKTFSVAAIMLAICSATSAQSDFRDGFVITQGGDSISGQVNFRDGVKAYEICDFREIKGATTVQYTSEDIAAYGFVGDKRFESKKYNVAGAGEAVGFFEVILDGAVTLYQFRESYWVQKGDGDILQLMNTEKEVYIDGKRAVRRSNQHIATLNMLLSDCPKRNPYMHNLRLDRRALTKVIDHYNACVGVTPTNYQETKPWLTFDPGLAVGATFAKLEFTGMSEISGAIIGTTHANSITFGFVADVLSPRITERFAHVTGALYSKVTYVTESKFKRGSDYLKIDLNQLKVPVGIKYLFKGGQVVPFVNAGASFTINLKSEVTWYEPPTSSNIEFLQREFTVKDAEVGYWGGLGAAVPMGSRLNWVIEFRYERTNGLTPHLDSPFLKSRIDNIQILMALKF